MKEEAILDVLEINPQVSVNASVIWLHGLGDNSHDFSGIANLLHLPKYHGIRFIFPNAPVCPVTVNGGIKMRSWYDILDIQFNTIIENQTGIHIAGQWLEDLMHREMILYNLPSNRIMFAGFSQGGALALYAGLRQAVPLAGVVALSTYQPLIKTLEYERSYINQGLPIFIAHGLFDPIIPFHVGKAVNQQLREYGYCVNWRSYPMQHIICNEEIKDISKFIKKCFQV